MLKREAAQNWLRGVPMHWMVDWGTPFPLFVNRAVLKEFFTEEAFAPLIVLARKLEKGIADVIIKHGLPWHVTRVGAHGEFTCCPATTEDHIATLVHGLDRCIVELKS